MRTPGPKRKGRHLYKGELAKPLLAGVYLPDNSYLTDKMKAAELDSCGQQAVYECRVEKLALLMEHYGIEDKADYFTLALKLAIAHVPGFRVGRAHELLNLKHGDYGAVVGSKRGRQRAWLPNRADRLKTLVKETKKKHHLRSDREALEFIVARNVEWQRPINRDPQKWIKTLRNQLAAARRRPEN
jgi:hypothetical protein